MKHIKTKTILASLSCSLISIIICGSIGIWESYTASEEFTGQAGTIRLLILIGAAAAILISLAIGLMTGGSLANSISEAENIDQSFQYMHGCFGNISEEIRQTRKDMSENMELLCAATDKASSMSKGSLAATQELADTIQETANNMKIVKTAITDIRSRTEAIREYTDIGREASVVLRKRAEKIKNKTKDSGARTQEMYLALQTETKKAVEQARAVSNIEELTQLLLDISSETSFLALNAAIEAAKAGEAGKGFAVVAKEINTLADRISDVADSVSQIIAAVSHAADNISFCQDEILHFVEEHVLEDYNNFLNTIADLAGAMEDMSQTPIVNSSY